MPPALRYWQKAVRCCSDFSWRAIPPGRRGARGMVSSPALPRRMVGMALLMAASTTPVVVAVASQTLGMPGLILSFVLTWAAAGRRTQSSRRTLPCTCRRAPTRARTSGKDRLSPPPPRAPAASRCSALPRPCSCASPLSKTLQFRGRNSGGWVTMARIHNVRPGRPESWGIPAVRVRAASWDSTLD